MIQGSTTGNSEDVGWKRYRQRTVRIVFVILMVTLLLSIWSRQRAFEELQSVYADLNKNFDLLNTSVLNLRQIEAEREEEDRHASDVKERLKSFLRFCRDVEEMPLHELPLVYWIQGANGPGDQPVYYLSLPAGSHSLSIECQAKKPYTKVLSLADVKSQPIPPPVSFWKRELNLGPGNYRLSITCQENKPVQVTIEFAQDGELVGTWAVDFPIEGLQATSHGQSSQDTINYYRPAPRMDGVIYYAPLGSPLGFSNSWRKKERILEVRIRGQLGIETP